MPRNPTKRHPLARPPKESLERLVMADLRRHPGATAGEISERTGLAISSVNWELAKYAVGNHEEPRYAADGYERKDGKDRAAQTWRLASQPKDTARRRLAALLAKVKLVVAEYPELAAAAAKDIQAAARKVGKK